MKKLNVPNTLSLIRALLVPVFVATLLFMRNIPIWCCIVPTIVYGLTGFTDMLDGKIARRDNLVTDFGKFMDPVADKFMVIGAMFVLLYRFNSLTLPLMLSLIVIVFRELAVTSMRLVASSGKGVVLAANYLGKLKTVSQIVAISTIFIEGALQQALKLIIELITKQELLWRTDIIPLSWISLAFCVVMTVWSGLNYIISYWKYLDPEK